MNFKADVWFAQRFLTCAGMDPKGIDGSYGKDTAAAEARFNAFVVKCAEQYGRFDDRTEGNIMSLLPKAQVAARKAMIAAKALGGGLTVQILSGTRTYAEQDALYAQGRTKPGKVVTKARAGYSNHNFGIAFDVGIFKGSTYYTGKNTAENKAYADLSKLIKPVGLDWGGDWQSIKDAPHYELHTGMSLTAVRAAFNAGKAYV
jgi:peptidoglycan L-alanyl-D-glutamate endopeptidase CwlK